MTDTLRSWVESAEDPATDFPIQNLPFGVFRPREDEDELKALGVAAVFTPGAPTSQIVEFLQQAVPAAG